MASPAGSALALLDSLTATIPFSADTRVLSQGVSPRTNTNAPRLAMLPVVCIPYLAPGQTVALPLVAVDEDGATVPSSLLAAPSTPYAAAVGGALVVSPLPAQILGVTLQYAADFVLFPVRVVVVDPVGQAAGAGNASTGVAQFFLRGCRQGGPVPVDYTADGVQVRYGVGDTAPVFAQSGRSVPALPPAPAP